MTQTTSPIGRAVLEEREGVRLAAYLDSKGIPTIGVGHTSAAGAPAVHLGLTMTRAEVDALFTKDLAKYEATVRGSATVPLADHEFDALVSLCYNIGQFGEAHSTVVKRLDVGDRKGAADAFSLWEKDKVLVTRREAERLQFLTPYDKAMPRATTASKPIAGITHAAGAKPVSDAPARPGSASLPPPSNPVSAASRIVGFWSSLFSLLARRA